LHSSPDQMHPARWFRLTALGTLLCTFLWAPAILAAPAIVQQPAAQTLGIGSRATFSVLAQGATAYQWQRNGVAIAGAASASYTTPVLAAQDNGDQYRVVVSGGGASMTSKSAALHVTGISVIAGTPGSGWGAVDGTALQARFWAPYTLSADAGGNLYAGDWNTVRRLTPTGSVKTLAGDPRTCAEQPGTGSSARFCFPLATLPIGGGSIIMGDWAGVLWQISPNGSASQMGATSFWCISGLAGTAATFYVADMCRGNVLWRVQGGVVTSFATLSSFPGQVSMDGAGNLYVAEGTFIEKVTPGGVVSLLAGGPSPGHADGQGAAASFGCATNAPEDEYLTAYNGAFGITTLTNGTSYVTDPCNHTVRRISPTGLVTTLAGSSAQIGSADGPGASARLWTPLGIAHDGAGNLFVSDEYNANIRKISAVGQVSTFTGPSPAYWGTADGTGTSARFNGILGIARDASGTLYVSDAGSHTIRRISRSNVVSTWAGSAAQPGAVDGVGSAARFNYPSGLALSPTGTLYVSDSYNDAIRAIAPDGTVTTFAGALGVAGAVDGPLIAARFDHPHAMAIDSTGALYVADTHGLRLIANGTVTTLEASSPAFDYRAVEGLAVDDTGVIYLTQTQRHSLYTMTQAGVRTLLAGADCPGYGAGCFGRADGVGTSARFMRARALAIGADRNVYVNDAYAGRIAKVTPAGLVTTVVGDALLPIKTVLGPLPGRIAGPGPLTMLPGLPVSFVLADGFEDTVLRVDLP